MADTPPPMQVRSRRRVLLATAACLLPLLLALPAALGIGFGLGALAIAAVSWRKPLPAMLRLLLGMAAIGAVAVELPGIGRDTACAVLAAMLALKPSETFSLRDGRALLGFALFAPFATFLLEQGPVSLVLALLAVVLSLLALRLLAEDEAGLQPVADTRWWAGAPDVLRLLALGLPLALAAFWLFPRLPAPLWGLPDRAVARPGLSDRMSPGGWLDLKNDDSPAARVQFFGPAPAREAMYWRGPVLVDFDGRTWQQPRWLERMPAAPLRGTGPTYAYEIELEPTDTRQLVALDVPIAAPAGARFGNDRGLYLDAPLRNVSRWRMRSTPAATFEPDLHPAIRQQTLALPTGFNPRSLALGRTWRREAGTAPGSDQAIVARALAMIRQDFAYTLNTPLAGRNEVDDFLFDRKRGYCEHYSSAFAVLMRAAGIPTRVVTGYAGGYRNPIGGYWLLLNSDAHAWDEVWLAGRGWVRVDPTAAVAPERVFDTIADRRPGRIGQFDGLVPMFDAGDWLRRGWNDFVLGFDAQRQQRLLAPLGLDKLDGRALILLFAAVTALAMAWMAWLIARGERQHDPLLRAWHRLGQRYARLGKARLPHEPAQDWAARVAANVPRAGIDLRTLSQRFSNTRYAADGNRETANLITDLARHRP